MSFSGRVKKLSVTSGLYRPARWLARRVHPAQRRAHLSGIRFYRSILPSNALCFDVGANIGEKSEVLLKAGARVVAFEPHPVAASELRARCGHSAKWVMVEAALGSHCSVGVLYTRQSLGQSSFVREWEGEPAGTCYVPVLTLDAAIQRFGKPYYCKIDVEGWELEVLSGLTAAIPLLSFEFHLHDEAVEQARLCMKRLLEFGPSEVNVVPAEGAAFGYADWVPLGKFLDQFPRAATELLRGDSYGDLFVVNTDLVSQSLVAPLH